MNYKYNYDLTILTSGLDELGIEYNDDKIDKLVRFYEMVVETNKVMNLTGITEWPEFVEKHFLDSFILEKAYPEIKYKKDVSIIDIGTGAGFPGIPLAIIYDQCRFTLLDTLTKRINFINEVIEELSLNNVETIVGRAEDFGKDLSYREQYSLCVTRAVAEINILSEFTLPFVRVGGYCIPYKSQLVNDEIDNGSTAVEVLGGEIEDIVKVAIPGSKLDRNLVVIAKVNSTPDKYPRRAGIPKKKPIK